MTKSKFFILVLAASFLIQGCAQNKASISSSAHPLDSTPDEIEMGRQIHAEIMSHFYVYSESAVVSYVGKIGKTLARNAKRPNLAYQFTTLYDEKIYATSAPGGYVYVTTGMLNFLDNESELAAVLAHEIERIQHTDVRISRGHKLFTEFTKGGMAVAPIFGAVGALASILLVVTHVAVEGVSDKTPDEQLLEADMHALNLMVESGYDPQGLIDLLHKFINAPESKAPFFYDYYQSRPITPTRFRAIEEKFLSLPLSNKVFTTNREIYQEATKGIREIYR